MNAKDVKAWLQALGKVDGGIAALAASWSLYDPAHVKVAILVAGIAGGLGMILNGISRFVGGQDVVNVGSSAVPAAERITPVETPKPPPPPKSAA